MELKSALVVDNGSGYCKGGESLDDSPRAMFPAVVGKIKFSQHMYGICQKVKCVGQQVMVKRGIMNLSYPIVHGLVQNWDHMTDIWEHCFYNQIRMDPSNHPIFLTEHVFNSKINRQKSMEIMMETFHTSAFYLQKSGPLNLYATGRTNGIVLQSGQGVTTTTPIYQGLTIPHGILRINFGGKQLTQYLNRLLTQIGLYYTSLAQLETIRKIKQQLCYVSQDQQLELKKHKEDKIYQLPDGQEINIGDQMFRSTEILFKPKIIGKDMFGFHQMICQSIKKIDEFSIIKTLYNNIVLGGGNTCFVGLPQRLQKQINLLAPMKIKLFASPQRKYFCFVGASILSSLSTFQNKWITKQQYQQNGLRIIHQKCI